MTDPTTETARALLYRHGLPEDVIDGVLCLHAQELAAVQRREAAVWGVDTAAGKRILAAADLIDPTRGAVSAVSLPPADQTATLSDTERKMLEYALDLADAEVATDGSDFTDDEEDALAELRRIVTKPTETDGFELRGDTEIRAAALREAADRLAELRAAEREWLPATGLHQGERELRRMADETPAAETDAAELLALATVLEIPRPGNALPLQLRRSYGHADRWAICDREGRRWDRELSCWVYEAEGIRDEALRDATRFTLAEAVPLARKLAAGARQDETAAAPCVECDHPKAVHRVGEDPVTPGQCADCPDDEDRHDYRPAAGARQDGAES